MRSKELPRMREGGGAPKLYPLWPECRQAVLGLCAGRPRRTGPDSALIWQYGPSAQLIVLGITAGDPQPDMRMGPLSCEELSHDVIVASHSSPVVGIYNYNLEGSVRRGFRLRLKALDWNQPVIIAADQNRQVIHFRAQVQAALWTLSRLPHFALAILLADAWFLLRRRQPY